MKWLFVLAVILFPFLLALQVRDADYGGRLALGWGIVLIVLGGEFLWLRQWRADSELGQFGLVVFSSLILWGSATILALGVSWFLLMRPELAGGHCTLATGHNVCWLLEVLP